MSRATHRNQAAVLRAIESGARTAVEVGRIAGMSCHSASDYLRTLVKRGAVVRVAPGNYTMPSKVPTSFAVGDEVDVMDALHRPYGRRQVVGLTPDGPIVEEFGFIPKRFARVPEGPRPLVVMRPLALAFGATVASVLESE